MLSYVQDSKYKLSYEIEYILGCIPWYILWYIIANLKLVYIFKPCLQM